MGNVPFRLQSFLPHFFTVISTFNYLHNSHFFSIVEVLVNYNPVYYLSILLSTKPCSLDLVSSVVFFLEICISISYPL